MTLNNHSVIAAAMQTLDDPQFQSWFSGSKAVKNGRPVLVFHGTPHDFEMFDRAHFFTGSSDGAADEAGFYFTTSSRLAARYAKRSGRVIPAFLRVQNPYIVTATQWGEGQGMSPVEAEQAGHDGYLIKGWEGGDTWIVFDPANIHQIKLKKHTSR